MSISLGMERRRKAAKGADRGTDHDSRVPVRSPASGPEAADLNSRRLAETLDENRSCHLRALTFGKPFHRTAANLKHPSVFRSQVRKVSPPVVPLGSPALENTRRLGFPASWARQKASDAPHGGPASSLSAYLRLCNRERATRELSAKCSHAPAARLSQHWRAARARTTQSRPPPPLQPASNSPGPPAPDC